MVPLFAVSPVAATPRTVAYRDSVATRIVEDVTALSSMDRSETQDQLMLMENASKFVSRSIEKPSTSSRTYSPIVSADASQRTSKFAVTSCFTTATG